MEFQDLGEVLSLQDSPCHSTSRELGDVIATTLLCMQNPRNAPTRTKFQQVLSGPPLSLFKKLLVLTPILLQGLHTMSLAKVVPDGLRDRECKSTILCKHPPVPYVPKKDLVQEMVSALKDQHLKTTLGEDKTLHLSIWHSGLKEALLMHVGSNLDAIKEYGHFKAHDKAQALYVSQKEVAK
jgi:hypothetical protein